MWMTLLQELTGDDAFLGGNTLSTVGARIIREGFARSFMTERRRDRHRLRLPGMS